MISWKIRFRWTGLALALGALLSFSAELRASAPNLRFRHITIQDGLSQNSVTTIVQDQQGFIWLGTTDGLDRFDGHRLIVFKHHPGDPDSLSHSFVNCLLQDERGEIWIGTYAGLNRYDQATGRFFHPPAEGKMRDLARSEVNALLSDGEYLWVGASTGLYRYWPSTGRLEHFPHRPDEPNSPSHDNVRSLEKDRRGGIWLATENGLTRFDPSTGKYTRYHHDPKDPGSLSHNQVTVLHEDRSGTLWIGTSLGLNRLDAQSQTFVRYRHDPANASSLSDDEIYTILEDSRGNLWIGTDAGLNQLDHDTGTFVRYQNDPADANSLSGERVITIFEDRSGVVWIGTWIGGVNILDLNQKRFGLYQHNPTKKRSLSHESVYAIYQDVRGTLWLGTMKGLSYTDDLNKGFEVFEHDPRDPHTLTSNTVWSITGGDPQDEVLWFGTNRGLNRYDRKTNTFHRYQNVANDPHSLSRDRIYCLTRDSAGIVWIGTDGGGLNRWDPSTDSFVVYRHKTHGLCADRIQTLLEDRSGTLWVGTSNGLSSYDRSTDTFSCSRHQPDNPNSLVADTIWALREDRAGNLWIGTTAGYLTRLDRRRERFDHFSAEDGIPASWIYCILEDDERRLWFSTNNGLVRLDPETRAIKQFDVTSGLQSNEFNVACTKNEKGEMFFGGIHGFNRFDPKTVFDNPHPPQVAFTELRIFNQRVQIGQRIHDRVILERALAQSDQIVLTHLESVFSLEFAALHFSNPKKNQFAYRLDGFEKQWNHVGNRNFATYTNLDPGRYTFRVKAANHDGVWNEVGAALRVIVLPPFWQTWWFRVAMGIALILALLVGHQVRIRRIKWLNRRLEKQVEIRTADLQRTTKELQAAQKELLQRAHQAGQAEVATEILHSVGNILNSVKTSASFVRDVLAQSKLDRLSRANALLKNHADNLCEFISNDPKGKMLVAYLAEIEEALRIERRLLGDQAEDLAEYVESISKVVRAQQRFADRDLPSQKEPISAIVKDAIELHRSSVDTETEIQTTYKKDPVVPVHRAKIIQILLHLLKNALDAMSHLDVHQRQLKVETDHTEQLATIKVSDNGSGIWRENLDSIFRHGFTTKADRCGFSLHTCANFMAEMGGKIWAESDGNEHGATFVLHLPLSRDEDRLLG